MQRDAVSFGIQTDGLVSILLTDEGLGDQNLAARLFHLAQFVAQITTGHVEVNQRAVHRRPVEFPVANQRPMAPGLSGCMGNQTMSMTSILCLSME